MVIAPQLFTLGQSKLHLKLYKTLIKDIEKCQVVFVQNVYEAHFY